MHLHQQPSGAWRAQGSVRGHRYSLTRPTRAEARHAAAEQEVRLGGAAARSTRSRVTVADVIAGHLAGAERRLSPTTFDDWSLVAGRLPETFLKRRVRDISPASLHALYGQLSGDGWSAHRVGKAHTIIGLALGDAVIQGHMTHNPAREVHPPRVDAPLVVAPSDEAVRAIRAAASRHLIDFLILATATGARRGELVALQWADVDFDLGTIWIRRSLAQKKGARAVARQTKTGSKGIRTLGLTSSTMAMLRRRHDEQALLAAEHLLERPRWIFSHDGGVTPWRPDYASRLFRQACERAMVAGVRLHDLRHHVATSMLRDGEEPIAVAGQLGHSTVATTLKVYAHYLEAGGRDAAERREARLR